MKWSEHWYNAVCRVFSEEQLTRKQPGEKGIIMVQLENEYIYFDMESEKRKNFCGYFRMLASEMALMSLFYLCDSRSARFS